MARLEQWANEIQTQYPGIEVKIYATTRQTGMVDWHFISSALRQTALVHQDVKDGKPDMPEVEDPSNPEQMISFYELHKRAKAGGGQEENG